MIDRILLLGLSAISLAACAPDQQIKPEPQNSQPESGDRATPIINPPANPYADSLEQALASQIRTTDRARDQYRHPKETIEFFKIDNDMTIGDYGPDGGWYTRILAPWLAKKGRYIGLAATPYHIRGVSEAHLQRIVELPKTLPEEETQTTGLPPDRLEAYTNAIVPDKYHGQFDRILLLRMLHNIWNWGIADEEFAMFRKLLKVDGMIGIVQHRAPAHASKAQSNGLSGYLREEDVIAFMDKQGFELVAQSEINANPKDSADHPRGVWSLPPSLRAPEPEIPKLEAIGESDRMTMLFRRK